jgi:hypothetical protein
MLALCSITKLYLALFEVLYFAQPILLVYQVKQTAAGEWIMKYGITLAGMGVHFTELPGLALQAETSGWDAVFIWDETRALSRPWEEAGATWWIENPWASRWITDKDKNGLQARVLQGPPH